ncbi:MAG: hypothetical protein GY847_11230 [Proteobacteria bacterium]|nr:hypothetical protein [Pseudomonadota bacterium]
MSQKRYGESVAIWILFRSAEHGLEDVSSFATNYAIVISPTCHYFFIMNNDKTTETGICNLCRREMTKEQENFAPGMVICDRCFNENDFMDALEQRGIHVASLYYTGTNPFPGRFESSEFGEAETVISLPYELGFHAEFSREGFMSRLTKYVSSEPQTGDRVFDDAVFVKLGPGNVAAEMLKRNDVRECVMEYLATTQNKSLHIDGNCCRFDLEGTSDEGHRALMILFHFYEQYAVAKRMPKRPDLLKYPNFSAIYKPPIGSVLDKVHYHDVEFEKLDELRGLRSEFRTSKEATLCLIDCRVLSGDLSPIGTITNLKKLILERTHVPEEQLKELRAKLPNLEILLGTQELPIFCGPTFLGH